MEKQLTKIEGLTKYAIVRRENRFVVTVKRGKEVKRALLRNTGRLLELIHKNSIALCLERANSKTDCEIIGILLDHEKAVLIDPCTQARAFEIAVSNKLIPWLKGWSLTGREVYASGSRLDYEIANGNDKGYMELKSAAYCDGYYAMYPDCPSERGLKHINILEGLNIDGYRSIIAFMAAHPYAKAFKPNEHADPKLAAKLSLARKKGVEVHAVKIFFDVHGNIFLSKPDLPIRV